MFVAYRPKTTYRAHGNAFGNAGGPCIIILTRGRNELFFRIIFKEKVIFLFFIFFFLLRDANETNAFIFRCQLWQIVWKIINQNLRPSSLTSSITYTPPYHHTAPKQKLREKYQQIRNVYRYNPYRHTIGVVYYAPIIKLPADWFFIFSNNLIKTCRCFIFNDRNDDNIKSVYINQFRS